jgi:Tfp pilus assembly protein PilF
MLTASKLLRTAGRVAEARKFTDALEKRFPKSTEAQAVRKLKW